MEFDQTKAGDIKYVFLWAVKLNFQKLRDLTARAYNVSVGLISTPDELANFYVNRYTNGLEYMKAFDQTPAPKSIQGSSMAKPFGETYVGQLLMSLLGGGATSEPLPAPAPSNDEKEVSGQTLLIWGLVIIAVVSLIAGIVYLFTKKG